MSFPPRPSSKSAPLVPVSEFAESFPTLVTMCSPPEEPPLRGYCSHELVINPRLKMSHSRYLEGRFKWLLIDGRVHGPEIAVMGEIGLRIRAKELDEVVAMCKVTDNRTVGGKGKFAPRGGGVYGC